METGGDPFRTMTVERAKREGSGKWERERTSPLLKEKNRKGKESTVPTMGEVEEAALGDLTRPLQTYKVFAPLIRG